MDFLPVSGYAGSMDIGSAVIVFIAGLLVLNAERRVEQMQRQLDRLSREKPDEAPQPKKPVLAWTNPRD